MLFIEIPLLIAADGEEPGGTIFDENLGYSSRKVVSLSSPR
jgi:hypothetical protein